MNGSEELLRSNLKTIASIKAGLKEVSTQRVLNRLGFTRQNLSQHLRESNAEKANVTTLNKIIDAIEAEKKVLIERAKKTATKAAQLINNNTNSNDVH